MVGTTASFSVTAGGTQPLSYQWSCNATNIASATNATLTLTNVQLSQAGNYSVAITNAYGSTNSAMAALTVSPMPAVPAIFAISPISGAAASVITLSGTNFSTTASSNTVYFGAVQATVLSASLTNLMVTVPAGATYAPITVTVNGLTAYANRPFLPTFAGNGSGISVSSFTPRQNLADASSPNKIVIADIDGDGKPDLIAGNISGDSIAIYRNISTNGSPLTAASFAPPVYLATPSGANSPYYVAVADVDGDGKLDIIASDYDANLVSIYRNISTPGNINSNSFAPRVDFATGSDPTGVAVRDIDGDGRPDLLVANYGDGTVSILRNTGVAGSLTTNSFAPKVDIATGSGCISVAAGDIDGDGWPDVVASSVISSTVSLLRNISSPGSIAFAPKIDFATANYPQYLTLVDLDGDGKLDVAVAGYLSQIFSVFRNTSIAGSLTTNSLAPRIDYPLGGRDHTIAIGDLDGDGKPDLAMVTELNSLLSIFRNVSTPGIFTNSSLAARVDISTGNNPWGVAVGDLDGDGRPDIVFGNQIDDTISIYQNATPFAGPPAITSQPVSRTNIVGTTAGFSVTAGGTQPLSYQWSCNATNIANATNATLTLTNVQLSQAGSYSVLVTNVRGATNSATASLTVVLPQYVPAPSGLVAWWPAEGNAIDVIGGNNGSPTGGISYTNGEVGQAFNFAGSGYIPVQASPSLNLGTNGGLTIECWIKPAAGVNAPVIEWDSSTTDGLQLWVATAGSTQLYSNMKDTSGNNHQISFPYMFDTNNFQHVAVTYDKGNGAAFLYLNGTNVASANFGNITPQTTYPVNIGRRTGQPVGNGVTYAGLLDELSLYNRALSSNEIVGIYNAGSAGKYLPPAPPAITSQPVSLTNLVGTTTSFSVTAGGTQPLSYQWSCNATNIANATNATLTLTNMQLSQAGNYSVAITNAYGSTNSATASLTVVLPPMIVTQPQSQSVVSFQSAAFTVAATGTGPLAYQWRKNGTNLIDGGNISGSATTNLHLAVVTLSDAGNYDVIVKNPYTTSNSVVAVLTVPQTMLTIGSTNAISGSTVTVPILMNALGVENALITSVGYQTNKLALQKVQLGQATAGAYFQEVDSQTNIGSVGFAILLNSGAVVPAGTQEVARLVFTALPVTSNATATLTFVDSPDTRQLADNNGNSLPAIYQSGTVSLTPGEYAADVYPRPTGDHQVTLQDWLEIGRMVARLDIVTNSDELLRADCAPRNAPDGVLTVADWVQAGRYALGLDPLTIVTPPVKSNLKITPDDEPVPTRTLQLGNVSAQRGQTVNVPVQLVCNTNENAAGMTVIYNTNQLQFISASSGSALVNGLLDINTNLAPGEVGVAVAMSPGTALAAGTNEIAVLQFLTGASASGTAPLTLDSSVIQLQVADTAANVLAANYVNGSVVLPLPPTLQTLLSANNLQLSWPVLSGSFLVQSASSLSGPWSNLAVPVITNGSSMTVTVQATNQQQFYRLVGQ
jgi:hypothetical protein